MNQEKVEWAEVEPIADEAFGIWTSGGDREWAQQAWGVLSRGNLTVAEGPLERLRVYVRFLVTASLYRDWCSLVFGEADDDSPQMWLSGAEVSPFHVGQLAGQSVDIDDPENDLDEALNFLMAGERCTVVTALLKGLDGVEGLFVSLWRSMKSAEQVKLLDDQDEDVETEADILNDVTEEKLAGYEWIREGCPLLGPQRVGGEIDSGW